MELKPHLSVSEFFHEAVSSAMKNQHVSATEMAEFYLVNLLSEYTTSQLNNEPLALRLAQAQSEFPEERARHLRDIGDESLYVSGFFADSLQRSLVDVDYYIQIGETAYGQLASMPARGLPGEVYRELSGQFPRFVDVLAEVSEGSALGNNLTVVQLYERWLRTGSEWIGRRLRAKGLLPGPTGGDLQ